MQSEEKKPFGRCVHTLTLADKEEKEKLPRLPTELPPPKLRIPETGILGAYLLHRKFK